MKLIHYLGKQIATAMYNFAVSVLILLPIIYSVYTSKPNLSIILQVFLVGYVVCFTLICVYASRFWLILTGREKELLLEPSIVSSPVSNFSAVTPNIDNVQQLKIENKKLRSENLLLQKQISVLLSNNSYVPVASSNNIEMLEK